jgi:propionate CoA-transferase
MARAQFMTADAAARLIRDGDTVALIGGGGGLVEAGALHAAAERRFLAGEGPRDLTLVHSLGLGDRRERGVSRLAQEGMVRKVIGGHWVWSPRMQELARANKIEAHVLPGGVLMQLYREIGARRPGLFSRVGLGTFVDPRVEGGRMNEAASGGLVEVAHVGGEEFLFYKSFPINVALLRGSFADDDGNVSLAQECAKLDIQACALAARNSGGKVIVEVRERAPSGALPAHGVAIPGAWVDAIVVAPEQTMTYDIAFDPAMAGLARAAPLASVAPALDERQVIARRAARELQDGMVVNFGFGVPDAVAALVAADVRQGRYLQTIEHGVYGGELLTGEIFGFSRSASAMIDAPTQFDFYSGGGLDIAFLGFGQVDAAGNVNASKLGGVPVGPGGFIDIAQNARKVVFCGSFDAKGARAAIRDGRLAIAAHGAIAKLVSAVDQITFSGPEALRRGQEVIYVTERAVFRLERDGLQLIEIAPGVDLRRDVLERMTFTPQVDKPPAVMSPSIFQ